MFPKLFVIPAFWKIPAFPVHFYGLFLALAFFAAIALAARRAARQGISADRIWDLAMWVLAASLVGSKGLLVIVDPEHVFSLRTAGVFYGGFIAATLVAIWYIRRHRLPLWDICDIAAPSIALGEGIGRIGCLSSGCCWGKPTTSLLGITFTSEYAHDVVGVPLHVALWPTQIILSLNGFLLAGLLLWLASRRRFAGQVFWSYVLLHSITRGLIEILRGDPRGAVGPLSTSQLVAIGTGMLAVAALVVMSRAAAETPVLAAVTPAAPARGKKRHR